MHSSPNDRSLSNSGVTVQPKPAPPTDIDVVADAALLIKNRIGVDTAAAVALMLTRLDNDEE